MKNRNFSTIQSSKQIERKVMKKAKKQWVVRGLLFSTILGGSLFLSNIETFAQETQKEWLPRTSQQIKSEIKGNEYVIQWGDSLSAISVATDISINRLAEINQIANVDLIYAGNKLVFGGEINSKTGKDNRVVAIQDGNGKTSVVINADENKPLVNQKETNKAKETENNGGTYTPPKTDNSGSEPLPEIPTVPTKPKPEESIPPVKPVDPVKPIDPEPPIKPIDPIEPEENEVDKSQLISLFNSTTNYVSTDYEEQSWLTFSNSRNAAKAVIDNPKTTSDEVLTATTNLQNGINQLSLIEQPVIVDKTALTDLYNSTINFVSTDYEINSWNNFKEIREESYNTISDPDATQEQVDSMTVNLQNAINQLIPVSIEETDKTALLALVEEVKDYESSNYTEESWNNFYQAFSVAVDVLADEEVNQEAIDIALNNLTLAVASLEEVQENTVNKEELTKLYNDSASLNSDDYTEKSWNDYILARSDAKTVLDNEKATQQEVDDAYNQLNQKIKGLVKIEVVNKEELTKLYNDSASLNSDDYTEKSWNDYILARSDAKTVLDNEKATQQEVDDAYNQLDQKIKGLVKIEVVNKQKLTDLYNESASLNSDDYTEKSWNDYILARSDAKTVLDNNKATQQEVDDAYTNLKQTIQNLEKKTEDADFSKLKEKTPTYSASMTEKIEQSVNTFRIQNGESELPLSQQSRDLSNKDAQQNISDNYLNWSADHNENAIGTTFSIIGATTEEEAVQKAMTNWINSPGHHDAMLWNDNGDIGASVYVMTTTVNNTVIYIFEFIVTMQPDWI